MTAPKVSIMGMLKTVWVHELKVALRNGQDLANPLVFFVLVVVLFPLGVSPDSGFLQVSSSGVIWVAALLATMLSLDRMFRADFDDGTLEQILVSGQPVYLIVIVKMAVHWLLCGLPLIVLSPILGTMLHMAPEHIPMLALTLLVGTPTLSLIGGIGAALTVSLRSGGVLISLIILPLTIPVLIFGTGTVQAHVDGLVVQGHLAILGALLALAATLSPLACAAALKMSVSS